MSATDLQTSISLVLIVILVGGLIGSIGVGGVLLVPAMTYLGDIAVHNAIAAAMFSYFFSGAVGAYLYASRGSIDWANGWWLCAGAIPGAFLGALLLSKLSSIVILSVIAIFVIAAGINALCTAPVNTLSPRFDGVIWLSLIGFIVGVCSSLSGTGGPLVLVPLLVWLQWPVITAVGFSQLIQLPISLLATAGNFQFGSVDFKLGFGIAMLMILGVAVGARLAHRLSAVFLRRLVGIFLSILGIFMLGQTVFNAFL